MIWRDTCLTCNRLCSNTANIKLLRCVKSSIHTSVSESYVVWDWLSWYHTVRIALWILYWEKKSMECKCNRGIYAEWVYYVLLPKNGKEYECCSNKKQQEKISNDRNRCPGWHLPFPCHRCRTLPVLFLKQKVFSVFRYWNTLSHFDFSSSACWIRNWATSLSRSQETRYPSTSAAHFWVSLLFKVHHIKVN